MYRPSDEELERKLRATGLRASADLDTRVTELAKQLSHQAQERTDERPHPRRRVAWIWKPALAAAAFVVVALAVWWLASNGDLTPSAYAELMQAVRKTKAREWVHWTRGSTERWVSFRHGIAIWRFPDGKMRYVRSGAHRKVSYTPEDNTVTISWEQGDPELNETQSVWAYLEQFVDRARQDGRIVETSSERVDGRRLRVLRVGEMELLVAVEGKCLVSMRSTAAREGKATRIDFDYPEEGPEDIYSLGVPRDARVVDLTAPPELRKLKERVEQTARQALPEYYAVVCRRMKELNIGEGQGPLAVRASVSFVHVKDNRRRVEIHELRAPHGITYSESQTYHRKLWDQLPAEDMGALERWAADRKPTRIIFYVGSQATEFKLDEEGKLSRREHKVRLPIEPRIWCLPVTLKNVRTLEPKRGRWGRLVGIESYKVWEYEKWYFNPERNYVCEYYEWGQDNQREVKEPGYVAARDRVFRMSKTLTLKEYARTPGGAWYPRKQTERYSDAGYGDVTYAITTRVDDTLAVPDGLFDPESVTPADFQTKPDPNRSK